MGITGFPHRVPTFWTWVNGADATGTISISGAVTGKRPMVGYLVLSANSAAGVSIDVVTLDFGSTVGQFLIVGADDGNQGPTPFAGNFTSCPFIGAAGDAIALGAGGTATLYYSVAFAHID